MKLIKNSKAVAKNTEGHSRQIAESKMTAELRKISDKWYSNTAGYRERELQAGYDRCKDAIAIEEDNAANGHKYGENALKLLCEVHNIQLDTLKKYVNIVRFISDEVFQEILKFNQQPEARHGGVEFSHLLELGRLSGPKTQLNWLRKICENRWSVSTTHDKINAALSSKSIKSNQDERKLPPVQAVLAWNKSMTKVDEQSKPFEDGTLLDRMRTAKISNVDRAESALSDAQAQVALMRTRLDVYEQTLIQAQECMETRKQRAIESGSFSNVLHAVTPGTLEDDETLDVDEDLAELAEHAEGLQQVAAAVDASSIEEDPEEEGVAAVAEEEVEQTPVEEFADTEKERTQKSRASSKAKSTVNTSSTAGAKKAVRSRSVNPATANKAKQLRDRLRNARAKKAADI